jgi:DNA-binding MarR family transcriptional regulator
MMDNLRSMDEMTDLFLKVVNRYNELERIPVFYENNLVLHLSEVHLIDAIGKNDGINITRLAKFRGVTLAAISKMIKRLVDKGLVSKKLSSEAENEVVLHITSKGEKVFEDHERYHDLLNSKLVECYADMSKEELVKIEKAWNNLATILEKIGEAKTAALKRKTSFPE